MFLLFSWVNAVEMAVLSGFWQKNGLGPLGVRRQNFTLGVGSGA